MQEFQSNFSLNVLRAIIWGPSGHPYQDGLPVFWPIHTFIWPSLLLPHTDHIIFLSDLVNDQISLLMQIFASELTSHDCQFTICFFIKFRLFIIFTFFIIKTDSCIKRDSLHPCEYSYLPASMIDFMTFNHYKFQFLFHCSKTFLFHFTTLSNVGLFVLTWLTIFMFKFSFNLFYKILFFLKHFSMFHGI